MTMMKKVLFDSLMIIIDTYNATPIDDKVNYPSPYDKERVEKKNKKAEVEQTEEIKTFDFGEVPLSDKEYAPSLLEDDNFDFGVSNPTLQAGHIVYHVKGVDRVGTWEGLRRYNEFYVLH